MPLSSQPEIFTIVPAPARALVAVAVFGLMMLALVGMFGYIAYSIRAARFEVSEQGLRIRGAFYGRAVPMDRIVIEEARALDLSSEPGLWPTMRTNGIGLPGYSSGWFRLSSGGRALLFVTDRSRVVYIPTRDDYALMLSVDRPHDFVASLRRAAVGGPAS